MFHTVLFCFQVLGTGDRKVLTLSHRAQMRRFTNDLVKLLKAQLGKQLPVSSLCSSFCEYLQIMNICQRFILRKNSDLKA